MEKLQSQMIFFIMNRNVLGTVWVLKRMMFALTLTQVLEGTSNGAAAMLCIREGLSAITDYAAARHPVNSTQQTSPPNPTPAGVKPESGA